MTKGNTLEDFKASHDKIATLHKRAKAALKLLSKDRWLYEGDFIKLAGFAQNQWSLVKADYQEYIAVGKSIGKSKQGQGRRVVAGSKQFAAQLREVANV